MNTYSEEFTLQSGSKVKICCDCAGKWAVHVGDAVTYGFQTKEAAFNWFQKTYTGRIPYGGIGG